MSADEFAFAILRNDLGACFMAGPPVMKAMFNFTQPHALYDWPNVRRLLKFSCTCQRTVDN